MQKVIMQKTPEQVKEEIADQVRTLLIKIEQEIPNNRDMLIGFYFTLNKIYELFEGRPQHLDKRDIGYIKTLYESGFTYGEIAFIMSRSKSTIHDAIAHVKRQEENSVT